MARLWTNGYDVYTPRRGHLVHDYSHPHHAQVHDASGSLVDGHPCWQSLPVWSYIHLLIFRSFRLANSMRKLGKASGHGQGGTHSTSMSVFQPPFFFVCHPNHGTVVHQGGWRYPLLIRGANKKRQMELLALVPVPESNTLHIFCEKKPFPRGHVGLWQREPAVSLTTSRGGELALTSQPSPGLSLLFFLRRNSRRLPGEATRRWRGTAERTDRSWPTSACGT